MRMRKIKAKRPKSPVLPGLVSPSQRVPAHIARPPYAATGEPGPSLAPVVRPPEEIAAMRKAGRAAAEVLAIAGEMIKPGIDTESIDVRVHQEMVDRGGYPSTLNYRGFPKSVCTSVNEVICHGIPDSRTLREGDIINIDITIFLDGVHGDTSCMFVAGETDAESMRLVHETRKAMYKGIDVVRPGVAINQIGRAIEHHAEPVGFGVVRDFIGHGIGPEFHTNLQILHYFHPKLDRKMVEGMSFTIEPMLTIGSYEVDFWDDDWTAVTRDGSRSAQFEHTLVVTEDGHELMTVLSDGSCAADRYA